MNQEGKKIIVNSAGGVSTSPIFRERTRGGALMRQMEGKVKDLRLNEVIERCPKDFLPVLTKRLKEIRVKYNANERELVMVADALVENLKAYVNKEVQNPMTSDEAIEEVRRFLAQQESDTSN